MDTSIFEEIEKTAEYLKLNISSQEIANVMVNNKYTESDVSAVSGFLKYSNFAHRF